MYRFYSRGIYLSRVDKFALELPHHVHAMTSRLIALPHLRLPSVYVHLHNKEKTARCTGERKEREGTVVTLMLNICPEAIETMTRPDKPLSNRNNIVFTRCVCDRVLATGTKNTKPDSGYSDAKWIMTTHAIARSSGNSQRLTVCPVLHLRGIQLRVERLHVLFDPVHQRVDLRCRVIEHAPLFHNCKKRRKKGTVCV